MIEQLSGIVDRFLFRNEETDFSVLLLQLATQTVVVTGQFTNVNPGQEIELEGEWITHPKFGKQFKAARCKAVLPSTLLGLKKYLSSGMIKGIGPTYAEKLISHFGTRILDVIDKTPEQLSKVPGIGPKRIEQIQKGWSDQKEIANIMVFLQDKGISPAYAVKIYKKYGNSAVAVVQENPYRLAQEVWGIGFKIADAIAGNLGIAKNSLARVKAGILHLLSQEANMGNVYCVLERLKSQLLTVLQLSVEDQTVIKMAMHQLYESHQIKLITWQDIHYIALASHYQAEKGIAEVIKTLQGCISDLQFDIQQIYQQLRTEVCDITLNEDQQRAILGCLQEKITVITGGPGTGKTTLIKKLLELLDKHRVRYRLAAPTGRAAKRMFEGTGRPAMTIHRLLEFDPISKQFVHNASNALRLDFLIIDEASMIDIFLAHALLKALPQTAHIVFIGDIDQLPSVGSGNFLKDLIASNTVVTVRLNHIFRQAADSLIIINAHRINNGEFPTAGDNATIKRDYIFIKEEDASQAIEHIKNAVRRLPGDLAKDCMILVPMNRGAVGTAILNQHLQELFNPGAKKQIDRGFVRFKQGDRVMQIRNNYDKIIFNGDIGFIETINDEDKTMQVKFVDRLIEYAIDELDELVLAYAVTIHKSQGSEYGVVIVPIFMQHFILLQRNLIYTAITRAKKKCIFIGQPKAIAMAIKNNKQTERISLLKQYLISDLACR